MSTSTANVTSRAVRAGGTIVRHVRSAINPSADRPAGAQHTASGWLAVTILCDLTDIDTADLPAPLAQFEDRAEVRVSPAADGKGTVLAARLRDQASSDAARDRLSGSDPQSELRSALRQVKQLIEVGEVLAVDPAPHGRRTPTPGGVLLEAWTKVAPKAGVR